MPYTPRALAVYRLELACASTWMAFRYTSPHTAQGRLDRSRALTQACALLEDVALLRSLIPSPLP